jgi:hypothetical protein
MNRPKEESNSKREIRVSESTSTADLLTLIGKAIGQLQQSIRYFEESDKGNGLGCLSTVITDIDTYLDRLNEDPLLPLARLDPERLRESLHHVQDDLSTVIGQFGQPDRQAA